MAAARNNRPSLDDVRTMPVGDIAKLPAEHLALLQEDADAAFDAAKRLKEWLEGAIARAKLYVEGALQTRKWQDQSGNDRYSTEVVLQGFNSVLTMLDGRPGGGGGDYGSDNGSDFGSSGPSGGSRERRPAMASKRDDMDDEIPF